MAYYKFTNAILFTEILSLTTYSWLKQESLKLGILVCPENFLSIIKANLRVKKQWLMKYKGQWLMKFNSKIKEKWLEMLQPDTIEPLRLYLVTGITANR
jgi:hypothetical protein